MSADELRRQARQHVGKARFEALLSIILGLILFVLFASACARAREVFPRLGFGLISLWSLYFAYQIYKWIWPRRLAPDGTPNTTLRSYRIGLEKRRDFGRQIWRKAGLTFCFLGLALIVAPELIHSVTDPRRVMNVAPVLVLLAIWLAVFFPLRKRRQRKLQHEIEQLRVFESENPN